MSARRSLTTFSRNISAFYTEKISFFAIERVLQVFDKETNLDKLTEAPMQLYCRNSTPSKYCYENIVTKQQLVATLR